MFAERIARPRYIFGFCLAWGLSLWAMVAAGQHAWYGGIFGLIVFVPIWCVVLITALVVFVLLRRAVKKERRIR